MTRAVIDTNVLVNAFLAPEGTPARLLAAWRQRRFLAVISPQLVDEYRRMLLGPRLAARLLADPHHVSAALVDLLTYAAPVYLRAIPPVTGDPDDGVVLATAAAGSAAYVVTGDRPLLALGVHRGVRLIPPAVFLALVPPSPPPASQEAP